MQALQERQKNDRETLQRRQAEERRQQNEREKNQHRSGS
jgi:hypothetical protein